MTLRASELRFIPPFSALSPTDRATAASAARVHAYRHGERLFQAGDACANVVILLEGRVRLFRPVPHGREVTLSLVASGGMFAMASVRGGTHHDISADAIGRAQTIELATYTFLALASQSPNLFMEIASRIVTQTDVTYVDAMSHVQGQLCSRVLHTLRRLTRWACIEDDAGTVCPLVHPLSHAEIARIVGAERSSVTHALGGLDARGLVRRERGHVTGVRP